MVAVSFSWKVSWTLGFAELNLFPTGGCARMQKPRVVLHHELPLGRSLLYLVDERDIAPPEKAVLSWRRGSRGKGITRPDKAASGKSAACPGKG